jgi:hypothetical protein
MLSAGIIHPSQETAKRYEDLNNQRRAWRPPFATELADHTAIQHDFAG